MKCNKKIELKAKSNAKKKDNKIKMKYLPCK